jgi:hypothetical protein
VVTKQVNEAWAIVYPSPSHWRKRLLVCSATGWLLNCSVTCPRYRGPGRSQQEPFHTGVPPRDVASNLEVSVPTLYRWIRASTVA